MPNYLAQPTDLNRVFQALADPTRRAVLERLSIGPTAMSQLAKQFNIALSSFSQHLDVLEQCGLVRSQKSGRVRTYQIQTGPIQVAESWMSKQRETWEVRLNQLDAFLLEGKGTPHE